MTAPTPQLLGGTDKAAIMVMLLAEEDASKILGQLTPDELRQLAGTMCGIGEVEPQSIVDAIAGFSRSTENSGISGHGRVDSVRRLLNGAVGEVKTENLMRQVAPEAEEASLPALGLLRWLDPKIIGEILADEHPQAIAVLLLQLDADVAAAALSALPEDLHTPVLHRVAKLGPVSRQAMCCMSDWIRRRPRCSTSRTNCGSNEKRGDLTSPRQPGLSVCLFRRPYRNGVPRSVQCDEGEICLSHHFAFGAGPGAAPCINVNRHRGAAKPYERCI